MQFGGPAFVLAIIAMSMLAWVITTAIRARHGYPVENEWGKTVHRRDPAADETAKLLVAENERLKATVGKLEERLKVLERIATDPSRQLADEIDKLR
jgi:cell division protein FtsB